MRESLRIPNPIRRLWRRWIEPLLRVWGYLDDLRGLIKLLRWVALFLLSGTGVTGIILSGIAVLLGWLTTFWFLAVAAIALVIALAPWIVVWRTQRHTVAVPLVGAIASDQPEDTLDPYEVAAKPTSHIAPVVMSDGVRWMYKGSYLNTGRPILEPQCPRHEVRLYWRSNSTETIDELSDGHWIDTSPYHGMLYCSHGRGHTFKYRQSRTHGEAKLKAQALMERQLRGSSA